MALPFILGAGVPAEPARMEILLATVRPDSASAHEFRVENQGFLFGARRSGRLVSPIVGDTMHIVGSGTLELVSTDSTKTLSIDLWISRREPDPPVRYTGKVVRIQRNSIEIPFYITTR